LRWRAPSRGARRSAPRCERGAQRPVSVSSRDGSARDEHRSERSEREAQSVGEVCGPLWRVVRSWWIERARRGRECCAGPIRAKRGYPAQHSRAGRGLSATSRRCGHSDSERAGRGLSATSRRCGHSDSERAGRGLSATSTRCGLQSEFLPKRSHTKPPLHLLSLLIVHGRLQSEGKLFDECVQVLTHW